MNWTEKANEKRRADLRNQAPNRPDVVAGEGVKAGEVVKAAGTLLIVLAYGLPLLFLLGAALYFLVTS